MLKLLYKIVAAILYRSKTKCDNHDLFTAQIIIRIYLIFHITF